MLRTAPRLLLGLAALAFLGACSDSVDPTLGTEQAFSLYGYLDPSADRQALRVAPIVGTIVADTARTLAATVTSEELGTGRTVAWRDSFVSYRDGSTGHVFVADYTPTPGATVEVRVAETTGEGRITTATVEVPPLAQSAIGEPTVVAGMTTYTVTVRAPRVIGGTLRLFVTGLPSSPADTSALVVPIEPGELELTDRGGEWTVRVPFLEATRDFLEAEDLFGVGLTLVEAEFAPFVTSTGWAIPPGGLDDDAIVEPGTFSNVVGGFGFVGSGFEAPVRWVPSPGTQSRAGFAVEGDPAGLVVVNEVGMGFVELYNSSIEPVSLGGYAVSAGAPEAGVRLPPTILDGKAFLVIEGPFSVTASTTITLTNLSGQEVHRLYIDRDIDAEPRGPAWGSYPDGLSYPIRGAVPSDDGHDLFRGPLLLTPGAPNRPYTVPAVINEISTSGEGFVEVLRQSSLLASVSLGTTPRNLGLAEATQVEGDFFVADETEHFALEQTGGTLYLLASYGPRPDPGQTRPRRVVDARSYGPQTPGRSVGYVPDGLNDPRYPDPGWQVDLFPTRGRPNAASGRLATRSE